MSLIVQAANFVTARSGGLRTAMDALALGYRDAGHDVVQVLPGLRFGSVPTAWGERVTIPSLPLPGTGYRVITSVRAAAELVTALRPDRLEVHDRVTLRGLARATGLPGLVVSHERLDRLLAQWLPAARVPGTQAALTVLADRSNAALARHHRTVVCTTDWAAEEFRRLSVPVTRVPLGVDLARHHPNASSPVVRAGLAADGEALVVLASRLSREKRPGLALDTVEELVRRGRRVRLVVAGHGPLGPALRVRSAGLPVQWLGFVSDRDRLAAVLAAADVVVAPGPVETFGLAALEAMAAGTPVVANARSALPEVLGSTGGLAAPGTASAFADAVEEVLEAPDGRFTPRARAERFPWSTTVRGFLDAHELPVRTSA